MLSPSKYDIFSEKVRIVRCMWENLTLKKNRFILVSEEFGIVRIRREKKYVKEEAFYVSFLGIGIRTDTILGGLTFVRMNFSSKFCSGPNDSVLAERLFSL